MVGGFLTLQNRIRFRVWLGLLCGVFCASACGEDSGGGGAAPDVEQDTAPTDLGESTVDVDVCPAEDRAFCEPCECDSQCGEKGVCVADSAGALVCTQRCSVSVNNCGPGSYCGQFGTTSEDFACLPTHGSCVGDGQQCSPCNEDSPCVSGFECHRSSLTNATTCFKQCTSRADCLVDTDCHVESGLCFPIVASKPRAVCDSGRRGICEPCSFSYDCVPGATCSNSICTVACEKFGGVDSTCPTGLFCVGGMCQPPSSYGCQGWLGCSFGCKEDQICSQGFCRTPCSSGCSTLETCVNGFCVEL